MEDQINHDPGQVVEPEPVVPVDGSAPERGVGTRPEPQAAQEAVAAPDPLRAGQAPGPAVHAHVEADRRRQPQRQQPQERAEQNVVQEDLQDNCRNGKSGDWHRKPVAQ